MPENQTGTAASEKVRKNRCTTGAFNSAYGPSGWEPIVERKQLFVARRSDADHYWVFEQRSISGDSGRMAFAVTKTSVSLDSGESIEDVLGETAGCETKISSFSEEDLRALNATSFSMYMAWDSGSKDILGQFGPCLGGVWRINAAETGSDEVQIPDSWRLVRILDVAHSGIFRPVAVVTDANSLASTFVSQTLKSFQRVSPTAAAAVGSQLETSEEEVEYETQMLNFLFKSFLGQNKLIYEKEPSNVSTDINDLRSANELTSWARRWNGSDAFGIIQFFTTVLFFAVVILVAARLMRFQIFERAHSEDRSYFPSRDEGISAGVWAVRLESISREITQIERDRTAVVPHAFDVLRGGLAVWCDSGDSVAATSQVTARIDALKDACHSSFSMLRDLLYLITTIGFLGTVIGIGLALGKAGGVLVGDQAAKQITIQQLTSSLSTAFDTTAIALILLLVSIPLLAYARSKEERFILDVETRVQDIMNSLTGRRMDSDELVNSIPAPGPMYVHTAALSASRETIGIVMSFVLTMFLVMGIWAVVPTDSSGKIWSELMEIWSQLKGFIP